MEMKIATELGIEHLIEERDLLLIDYKNVFR